ncbi:R2-like ligand-binding oxidase [Chloroflexus aggregans]|uniref:R2-like ligand binding oxidase n=1 Tax=Chloroflexus aggregans (strain MD-66 / DSM 9485) TaxID=326427 RepID=B8G6K1_CHLAD|nr:R2-like ligand-binding oxidase [Chloroflexus aggregans]ACL23938.1 ribonucleotide reductase [Chloroflexus aggregans DSM 9485]
MSHTNFVTTSRGLRRNSPPMRLFEKAKQFGIWNPSLLDFSRDIDDWNRLSDEERDLLLRLTALFQAGEEAVTLDLLPLIKAIAHDGRLEEELFLTTFLFEEAKHTDFFARFISEVARVDPDLSRYHTPSYRALIYDALPRAMQRLEHDPSPFNLAEASLTYNMIVEGVLAETGYHGYFTILDTHNLMPGVREGIRLLKQDESRHIAYGIYLLSRLIAADRQIWDHIVERMNELVIHALGVIDEIFTSYDTMPFGLQIETFSTFALNQFQRRLNRLELACQQSLAEIEGLATDDEEAA